jgi:hypothetical protein
MTIICSDIWYTMILYADEQTILRLRLVNKFINKLISNYRDAWKNLALRIATLSDQCFKQSVLPWDYKYIDNVKKFFDSHKEIDFFMVYKRFHTDFCFQCGNMKIYTKYYLFKNKTPIRTICNDCAKNLTDISVLPVKFGMDDRDKKSYKKYEYRKNLDGINEYESNLRKKHFSIRDVYWDMCRKNYGSFPYVENGRCIRRKLNETSHKRKLVPKRSQRKKCKIKPFDFN